MISKRLSLPVLLLLIVGCSGDLFESVDTDHDGIITRQEYDQGVLKLDSALKGPAVVPVGAAIGAGAIGASTSFFSFPASAAGSFWKGFTSGVAMILATEIGDKTFFIAAVLSMRHDRSAVFSGAILALIIMTILSSCMGLILPQFLPRQYTHIFGGLLFLYFGIKLIVESRAMEANRVSEELEEVEEELSHSKKRDLDLKDDDDQQDNAEDGKAKQSLSSSSSASAHNHPVWVKIFLQSLTLTFVAEWGDRSQIATIALAAAKNPYGVTVGGCLGHSMCTGLAVMGGRMLAARISEKTVSFYGGCIFLVFGLHSLFLEN